MRKIASPIGVGLCTTMATLPPTAAWSGDFAVNGLCYTITNHSTHEVSLTRDTTNDEDGYGYQGDISIPETVSHDGATYSVTGIGASACSGYQGLTGDDTAHVLRLHFLLRHCIQQCRLSI